MTKASCPPPVGGETIAILGTTQMPGFVLNQCLTCRGFLPIMVTRPQEAVNLIEKAMVSALVIMESVPVDTVHSLCGTLRARNRVTPIIALLSEANRSRGIALLEVGADHFDVQPVSVEDLLRALYAFTRRTFHLPEQVRLFSS
ncbi:hypothetical protein ACN2XU_14210 [Primorskyibacter sp. 2E107]|uniref:hypothetical protein n=1 Tax=Primorskyibacter sp. 2E107 TaxID=3403458 RepID=UPI003AF55F55